MGYQIPVTHVTMVDTPFKDEVVATFFAPDFKTIVPDYAPNFTADESEDEDRVPFEDAVETKVVKPRGRRPKAPTEGVETK